MTLGVSLKYSLNKHQIMLMYSIALGLLYLQTNQLDDAEKYFLRLTEFKKRVFDANYYLARIAEERDQLG